MESAERKYPLREAPPKCTNGFEEELGVVVVVVLVVVVVRGLLLFNYNYNSIQSKRKREIRESS